MRAVFFIRTFSFLIGLYLFASSACASVSTGEPLVSELLTFVESWKNAWQSQRLNSYASHYSAAFSDQALSRDQWLKKKRGLFAASAPVTVILGDLCLRLTSDRTATVNFRQSYRSGAKTDHGLKELQLAREHAGWRIVKESWRAGGAALKVAAGGNGLVQHITVENTAPSGQQVLRFQLQRFALPTITAHPETNHVILRFPQSGPWRGSVDTYTGSGPLLHMSTFATDNCATFVCVLSLAASRNGYKAEQFYYKKEKVYELRINPLPSPAGRSAGQQGLTWETIAQRG